MTWRLAAALGALLLLALGVDAVFANEGPQGSLIVDSSADLGENGEPLVRKVDLIASVERFDVSDDFAVGADGLTVGFMDAVLDEVRVMRVAPGTPGQVSCDDLTGSNDCVVFADLLGEAVVWFAVLPQAENETVVLPPVVDLQDGYALFENGWQVRYPPVIKRNCTGEDVASFSDFLRRFGDGSTSIVDLETQKVTEVVCGEPTELGAPGTTISAVTTTEPAT